METAQPLQIMVHHDDALHDLRMWAKRQVLQIENLSKQQVLLELQGIMEGHSYSWHCINEFLQARFDDGSLELSLVDGDVLFEWNNLCDEKRVWEKRGRLSVNNAEFNMDCLINLKILPVQAGLGIEGRLAAWLLLERANRTVIRLVTSNMDKPNISTVDLWAGPKDPESLTRRAASWFPTDDDTSSLESNDSDYVDEEVETDDEGVERKGVKFVLFDDKDGDESDEVRTEDEGIGGADYGNLSEDEFDEEESEGSVDSFVESEVETEDEDVGGLGVKIVDIDDNEISDLELWKSDSGYSFRYYSYQKP